jgi:drug/metabolite transporter (DMT)-like permease
VKETELAMVLGSALLHAVWSASLKGARSPLAFTVTQCVIAFGLLALAAAFGFELSDLAPRVWGLLAATGVAHGLYAWGLARALERAELTLVYPITRATPALLPLVAIPLLGDDVSLVGGLGIAVVVGGMALVQMSGGGARRWLAPGLGWAWLTLAATVGYSLLDKAAMSTLNESAWTGPAPRSVAWFFLIGAAGGLVFVPLALLSLPRAALAESLRRDVGRALSAQAVSLASYGLVLEAFRTASASYVVAVRQTSVLFAVGIAAAFLRERPSRARVLGALGTVAGVALIALGG